MLHIHRAERADALVAALRDALSHPLPDAFAPEVICVPTRGMERWLTQRLSGGLGASDGRADGVCANVDFPFPHRLVEDAVAVAAGIDPAADPWLPERMVWPLVDVVDECLDEPWLALLAAHVGRSDGDGDAARRGRRFSAVRHIAALFDRYALHRPEMLGEWAANRDTDGLGKALPAGAAWQAELWRRINARLGVPGPAERLEAACERLRDAPDLVRLPERLSLFGLTRLPAGHLQVLRALSAGRDVHLFLLHPSPALWGRVAETMRDRPAVARRSDDPTAELPANRLLASWGRDSRELQLVATGGGEYADTPHPVEHRDDTLLARIQTDVRADSRPPGPPLPDQDDVRPPLDPDDRSLEIHACHGRARQVEVLRDAILHMLEEDPALEPRDVIVMCPDIETFAPLIQATFGAAEMSDGDEDDGEALPAEVRPVDLRVRLADRALRQTNPVLGVIARVTELAEGRLTASEVLDLGDREPVRRRFRFDDDDLARIQDWVSASGIRWGLDAEHRVPFKLDGLAAGTWRSGLDRVLVGVAMSDDEQRLFEGVLPLDDVDSGSIDLAGRFAEFVERLRACVDDLRAAKTIGEWAHAIAGVADSLTATTERQAWQRSELDRILANVLDEATVAGADTTQLELAELRALLSERLQGRPTRANFRTGNLTICTLVPMRSVPHRVVCLLGMDDGVFPRKAPRDGDDLLLDDPDIGDRDPRAEDRQMLLDALLAATDRLLITYSGHDERTNVPLPPAVPVGELLDVVDATVRSTDEDARDAVVTQHPLQPFDPRNFEPEGRGPWSFDRVTLDGARALAGERTDPRPFLLAPLPGAPADVVELDDLIRFVQHPVRAFLRRRLGISLADFSDEIDDALPVELDNLEAWGIGQRLLDARLGGASLQSAVAAEIARGMLPPGLLARPVIERVRPVVEEIARHAEALPGAEAEPTSVDVRITLADGRLISGTVAGVRGDLLRSATYSRVNARHRLAAWVRLLALAAAYPERRFEAATVGRAMSGAPNGIEVSIARIPSLEPEVARESLATVADLFDRGMREPLPLAGHASAAYAQAVAAGKDPAAAAAKAWESEWNFPREDRDLEHQLALGGVRRFAHLLDQPPRPDEAGDGWDETEGTRFGRYARRLWDGLVAVEVVEHR